MSNDPPTPDDAASEPQGPRDGDAADRLPTVPPDPRADGSVPGGEAETTKQSSPIVRVFLRGLAIMLPPVLTLVILIWIFGAIYDYVISPVSQAVQYTIAQVVKVDRPAQGLVEWEHQPAMEFVQRDYVLTPELRTELETLWTKTPDADAREIQLKSKLKGEPRNVFVVLGKRAVPYDDYATVVRRVGISDRPTTAIGTYMELVTIRYFPSLFHLSVVAVILTIFVLWFIGGFVTARLGKWMVTKFESAVVGRVPVVSNVYSSVKQVTDFFFTERSVSYNRVVAVEYPRRGAWSVGFVTGDSMLEVTAAAGEPMLAVLMPTSPMPMTGFTIMVPKSQVIDLNISIDQAFQFCLSCGVLVPPQQKVTPEALQAEMARRITGAMPRSTVVDTYGSVSGPGGAGNLNAGSDPSPSQPSHPGQLPPGSPPASE